MPERQREESFRMNEPASLEWNDDFKLGYTPMDETHEEFVEIVNAMLVCPDDELAHHLATFATHAVAHFSQEQRWMAGSDFPAAGCHLEEHDAVMKSVREVQAMLEAGAGPVVARKLAAALADWFPGHADYLDSALAQWLVKKKTESVPLVFRRKKILPMPSLPS
jgi:hemerythrin